jgi:hypothetical protein
MSSNNAIEFVSTLKRKSDAMRANVIGIWTMVQREIGRSIRTGSELTGAPGQPVDTGNLRNSWVESYPSATLWMISTNVEYAEWIEDGGNDIAAFTLRSEVGGFHSVKLTEAAYGDIVAWARDQVVGGA